MSDNTLEIGKCIKKARLNQGLTIRELAEKTGLTSSMLSQIERDLANPSINTLKTISIELNVPIYKFFQSDETENRELVVRKNERKTIGNPQRNLSYELLTPDTRGNIEFVFARFVPCGDETAVSLSHEGEETGLVISGKIDVFVDEIKYTLDEGDSIRIPSNATHYWINSYEEICELVFAITPPSF